MMSTQLVPGDVIKIPDHGCQLLCDAVLLEGQVSTILILIYGNIIRIQEHGCQIYVYY